MSRSLSTQRSIYVIGETSARDVDAQVVGSKAHNLMRMSEAGLPVPPAFVLGTEVCRRYHEGGIAFDELAADPVDVGIETLERSTGLRFGGERRPLLVAVRSGAAVSMPGMLDTLLDIGLSDATLPGLLRATGDPVFVWDSYRRLIQAYAEVVQGCPAAVFEAVLADTLAEAAVPAVAELDVASLQHVVRRLQGAFRELVGHDFPQDPRRQVLEAVEAVLRSWNAARAVEYRALQGLDQRAGTAVTVQAMVFGNKGVTSGAGVGFTRDPATGERRLYVDFLLNAQGEDVVGGRHVATDTESQLATVPELAHGLQTVRRRLEAVFRDAQDFEFTVEEGKLWLLQTRGAKRTPWAALHIACDLVDDGLIDPAAAVERLRGYDLDSISRTRLDSTDGSQPITSGTPASTGVASGRLALDVAVASQWFDRGDRVVLVRHEPSTDDIAGLSRCRGLLTATGARTAHAAVVALQLGVACVVGCRDLSIDLDRRQVHVGPVRLDEGEPVTIDGSTGAVYRGELELRLERPQALVDRVRVWQAAFGSSPERPGVANTT